MTIKLKETERTLPVGWRWARLDDLVSEAMAGFACGSRDPAGVIQLRMNNVDTRGGFVWREVLRVPADERALSKYQLKAGDVLFNNTNSTALVGKSALFSSYSEPVVYSNHFTRIRVNPSLVDATYLATWLLSQWQERTFENLCNRWIGQSAVKNDKLLALEMPLPPLAEQKRIAALLNEQMAAVERVRAAAESQLAAGESLWPAELQRVFPNAQATRWPLRRLADVGQVGSGITLGRELRNGTTRRVPYLRVANVKDGYLDLSDVYEIEATEAEIDKCRLQHGDLLLTEGGDPDKLGRGSYWECQLPLCIHQNHIYRVRFNPTSFSPPFVSAQFESAYGKAYFAAHAKQTTGIATINQKVLGNFPLLSPTLDEQQRVAASLAERKAVFDRLSRALRDQLDALNKLPGALLRQAFSGQL